MKRHARWIAEKGYDPKMGARPMARVIQEHVKRPLAEELLFGKLSGGGQALVTLSADGQGLKIECVPRAGAGSHRLKKRRAGGRSREQLGRECLSGRDRRCGPCSGRTGSSPPLRHLR